MGCDPNEREGQANSPLHRAHPNPLPQTFAATATRTATKPYNPGERNGDLPAVARVALQTRRPVAGLKSYGRPARKTYTGYACEGCIHLLHKVPALARRSGLPAAPLAVHKNNHSAPPASQQSLHTDLDHAIATCFTRIGHVRFHMKKPDLRRGWGLRRGMRIASSERRTTPPILPGA